MQCKGRNPTQVMAQYVNRRSAKIDFEKGKQNKVRGFRKDNFEEVSKMGIWAPTVYFEFVHVPNHIFHLYITHDVQHIQILQSLA